MILLGIVQIFNFALLLLLVFFTFVKRRRDPIGRQFVVLNMSVLSWILPYIFWTFSSTAGQALVWTRVLNAGAATIPITLFHFVSLLIGVSSRQGVRRFLPWAYACSAVLALLNLTPIGIKGVRSTHFFPWWPDPGPTFYVYFAWFAALVAWSHILLFQEWKQSSGQRRRSFTWFLAGSTLGFLGGGMNFFPWFNIDIYPLGTAFVGIYGLCVSYAILAHSFLDIRIVIRRSLVYSILVTLLTTGYFGAIYLIERVFLTGFGYNSPLASVAAFALMALIFQPLKVGIQRLVDWLIFRKPQEELVKRMEHLEQQALQAEKFKAVSTLAAGMAHEIKNPLTALKTFAEFIPEKHQDPEFIKKLHETLVSETTRIQEIAKDLLDFAKPKPPKLRPVDLAELIRSTAGLLSSDLLKRRIQWTIDCQHNCAALQADSDQLRQVLINLIQNAADAMPQGGTLTLATQSVNSHIELTVHDTGQGIPPALLPKIFDPFVSTKSDGNGLGLAMVYSILRAHRGFIRADSRPGRGTTFTVELPL